MQLSQNWPLVSSGDVLISRGLIRPREHLFPRVSSHCRMDQCLHYYLCKSVMTDEGWGGGVSSRHQWCQTTSFLGPICPLPCSHCLLMLYTPNSVSPLPHLPPYPCMNVPSVAGVHYPLFHGPSSLALLAVAGHPFQLSCICHSWKAHCMNKKCKDPPN